jgi:DNA-binding CsgD family transcriptional regulator
LYVFSHSPINLSASERTLMNRISTHLAAAYRLQRQLEHPRTERGNGVAATLRIDGRIEHAEPATTSKPTRRDLSEAVKAREWAKTARGRRDSQRATAAWRPLVGARWSLVDSYERNGTRYITARENVPALTGVATLSLRERQVGSLAEGGYSNKLIAYELGLAHSTVRVLLARAAGKLGARTRAELIQKLQKQRPSLASAAQPTPGAPP